MFQNATINGSSEEMFINSTEDVLESTFLGITKHAHFQLIFFIINQEFWNIEIQKKLRLLDSSYDFK